MRSPTLLHRHVSDPRGYKNRSKNGFLDSQPRLSKSQSKKKRYLVMMNTAACKPYLFGLIGVTFATILLSRISTLNLHWLTAQKNVPLLVADKQQQSCTLVIDYENKNFTFCVDWNNTDMDAWWMHHADWFISSENDTHYCFARIQNARKARFMRNLYKVQFKGNCSKVMTKEMWSSGWGADFNNVIDGLFRSLETGRPMQMFTRDAWHYAAKKDASRPVCPSKDINCYFLNISRCEPNSNKIKNGYLSQKESDVSDERASWAYEYASRPQLWLRRAVYEQSKQFPLETPCTVMHVRRADVVLHQHGEARKYHAISEYVNKAKKRHLSNTIFLLTDDQNAIEEATTQYPQYNWVYLTRPRHRGTGGGWENQIPSNDPRAEVVTILSTFQLVRRCNALVHSISHFSDYLYREMEGAARVDIDEGLDPFSSTNILTMNISKRFVSE